jgi:hypothetical protein
MWCSVAWYIFAGVLEKPDAYIFKIVFCALRKGAAYSSESQLFSARLHGITIQKTVFSTAEPSPHTSSISLRKILSSLQIS